MIVALNPSDVTHRRAAAELHGRLLPESPIAALGQGFMQDFYYRLLVRDGLIACDLYRLDGKYVGFASYTKYPFTFMKRGYRKHFWPLALCLGQSVLARPARIGVLIQIPGVAAKRASAETHKTGEFLSFGVEAGYGTCRDAATGKKIPNLLFENLMGYFRGKDFDRLQFIVRKENRPSLLFFNAYGAQIETSSYVSPDAFLMSVKL